MARKGSWLLYNQIPLIGSWLRRKAINDLVQQSTPAASAVLAEVLSYSDDEQIRLIAEQSLATRSDPATISTVCVEWSQTRSPALLGLIQKNGWLPVAPTSARLLVALKTGKATEARSINQDGIESLVAACADQDSQIAQNAKKTIVSLGQQQTVDQLCQRWAELRDPFLDRVISHAKYVAETPINVRVLTALRNDRFDILDDSDAETVSALLNCMEDPSEPISRAAKESLLLLKNSDAINAVCSHWASSRNYTLDEIVASAKYVATSPMNVRVLSALRSNHTKILAKVGSAAVPHLFQARNDSMPLIAEGADRALRQLKDQSARDAVCRLAIEQSDQLATQIAKEAQYAPTDRHEKAFFYFLTEQWTAYEDFDFDNRLLQAIYSTGTPEVKSRITDRIRQSGRAEYLAIITRSDARSRSGGLTPAEIDFTIQMLVKNSDWGKLWLMAMDVPLFYSVIIVRLLAKSGWQPKREDDQVALTDLMQIASQDLPETAPEISPQLPPATLRATARVSGRVGDVAFSPTKPWLAISGKNQVVIWDFQKGKPHTAMRGFSRSVGAVAFSADNRLLCVEGMQHGVGSILHTWFSGQRSSKEHPDMITAISPLTNSQMLVSRYDCRALIWDSAKQRIVHERTLGFWPRSSRVDFVTQRALLLHEGAALLDLRDLSIAAETYGKIGGGVSRCAAFAPDSSSYLIGNFNGNTFVTHQNKQILSVRRQRFADADGKVQGIEVLNEQGVVVIAGANGRVDFISWENEVNVGSIRTSGKRLTSMHVSPSGEFLALGHSDNSMSFWDLRVLHVPLLISLPFSRARPLHLAAVEGLARDKTLSRKVRNAIEFMARILRHRFRYDIEIAEVQTIRAGEFDIEIE